MFINHVTDSGGTPIDSRKDTFSIIVVGLLEACIKKLEIQGMRKVFLDGISSGVDDFKKLGKQHQDEIFSYAYCSDRFRCMGPV